MSNELTKILIIEDDESIALGLKMNLEAEGYGVMIETDGESGLAKALSGEADLLILDVMLPRSNGFEVLQRFRESGSLTPVIMLSARGAETEKVMGLELGAEDYITKPFGLAELLARVRAVLRRGQVTPDEAKEQLAVVIAGSLNIDSGTRVVTKNETVINLTATEFDVLWCLVAAEGQVLSRQNIQDHVWGPEHHGTLRTIDNFLLQLRSKLEDDPVSPEHLLTVRGVGYRFSL
jgi:two-component system alkaline phosphatase synthesis response regulator PhoP